nr:MBL fold metallo-hydrolase [uncultured Faecalibacillus sp.]
MNRKIANTLLASSMVFSMATSQMTMIHAVDENGIAIQDVDLETVQASYEKAIAEVKVPKYAKDGSKIDQGVSEYLRAKLDTKDLSATKEESKKLLTVDVQLKDVNLTSDYINGKSPAGISYYNMMNFFTNVKQVKQLLDANPGYQVKDSKGNVVDACYVDELLGLLQQINDFDPTTNLQYDYDSVYNSDAFTSETTRGGTDVIATSKEGNVSFKFHIDSHGWWGYDLGAHDSITGLVMGEDEKTANENQHDLTTEYGNFFVIKMKEDSAGTWYMLRDTDLENPMMYVSKDGKEAFMIDVDFYGENVLNEKIKAVIGDKCESLKIFLTHNHPDHVNNLDIIGQDETLRNITTIVWPEKEPHTNLNGKDLISDIQWKGVQTVKDMEKFTVAGSEFQFLEISNEHTPGGGQLADLTHKVIYSGDTLGAQVHLGGTTIRSGAQEWYDGAQKAAKYIKENGIQYNIGGHTPYLNNADFASWLATAVDYGMKVAPKGYTLVIVENGKVVNGTKRYEEIMANGLSDRDELNICSVGFIKSEDNGSAERAARSIILPRYEKDGTKVDQYISDDLKSHLALVDIEKVQDETQKTFTVNVQLKDVNLTSDYINGKSEPGISYYNMLSYYIDVLQVKELVDKNEGYSIIDSKGNKVDAAYVNELVGLLKQINDFDPTTDLQYDWDSAYDTDAFKNETTRGATDVIATSKEGNVTLRFHIDSHGWWGYDFGAHTPYLNNADFASWLAAGVEYGINEADEGYTLIIVENGKVINGTDRYDEIMKNGLSDRDELNICSLGFIKEKTDPDTPDQPENPTKPGDTKKPDSTNTNITTTTDKTKDNVKTGDDTEIFALVGMMVLAGGTICMIKRKKHN